MQKAFVSVIGFIIFILIFTLAACTPQSHPSRAKIVTPKSDQKTKTQTTLPAASTAPPSNNDSSSNNAETPSQTKHFTEIHMMVGDDLFTELPEGWALGYSTNPNDYQVSYHVYHTTDFAKTLVDVTAYELLTTKYSGLYHLKGAFIDKNTARIANCTLKNGTYETNIYGTNDAGKSWFGPVVLPSLHIEKGHIPVDISFINAKEGWVLTRIVSSGGETESRGGLYHTTDGGKSWNLVSDTPKNHTLPDVNGSPTWNDWIVFKDSKIGFSPSQTKSTKGVLASNSTGLYRTMDGGSHWSKVNIDLPATGKTGDRILLKPTLRADYVELPVATMDGNTSTLTIFESQDSGKTWSKVSTQTVNEKVTEAVKVRVFAPNQYWFFTGKNFITMDDGDVKTENVSGQVSGGIDFFDQVGLQDWAINSEGHVFVSDNNGRAWHKP